MSSACSHSALLGRDIVETIVGELVTVVCELLYFATVAAEVEQDEDDDYDDEGDNTAAHHNSQVLVCRLCGLLACVHLRVANASRADQRGSYYLQATP